MAFSRNEMLEQYSNALVLREIANAQVAYWEGQLQSLPVKPVKLAKKRISRKTALSKFKMNIILGRYKS